MASTDSQQSTSVIEPTVGRIVYHREFDGGPEQAAIITQVHSDRCVNLCVFTRDGGTYPETSCVLRQPGEDAPRVGPFCEWMPYQEKKAFGSESGESAAGTKQV